MAIIKTKEVTDYIDFCDKNPDMISDEVKLLIKNIVLPLFERDDLVFNETMYRNCINYCEKWYVKLFIYQKFILYFLFIFYKNTPYFKIIFTYMGRGNGKDGFISPTLNFFQTPMYNIKNYHIEIVANSEDQANDSFDVVYEMLEENKEYFKPKFKWNKEVIANIETGSKLRFNTSNAKTKDGKKIGALWFNEYHAYESADQVKVFTSALGKIPHARTFITSTDGNIRDGVLDELMSVSKSILKGEENSIRIFPFICRIQKEEEADDPRNWIKANPSIDDLPTLKEQIEYDYIQMQKFPSLRVEFFTKRMNFPKRDDAIMIATWEQIRKTTHLDEDMKIPRPLPELRDRSCIVGIDFADLRDFATAGFLFNVDGEVVWISKTWICTRSPFFKDIKFPFEMIGQPGYQDFELVYGPSIDAQKVIDWVYQEMSKYYVMKIIMDSYRFRMIKKIFESYGIEAEDRDNPNNLVRMIRNLPSVNAMVAPIIEYNFAEGKINAGNSALWRWACNNTGVQIDGLGNKRYFKIEPKLRKNDPLMAHMVAMSEFDMLEPINIYI